MDTNSMDENIRYFIQDPDVMTEISNQKAQRCSFPLAIADMMTMIMRMSGKGPYVLLSPQPLIDAIACHKDKSFDYLYHFCTSVGLESLYTYPFTRVPREWDENVYRIRKHQRYTIDDLTYIDNKSEIKKQIVLNFGPGGKKFPILGALYMGKFIDRTYARACEESKKPYCPPPSHEEGRKEEEHALLIVGCDTTSTDSLEHHCRVKNTFGKKWGKDGFSLVAFEALNYILVPAYNNEAKDNKSDTQVEDPVATHQTLVYDALSEE